MQLNAEERAMLNGEYGQATRKAMEILVALGTIYEAECMVPVKSVQISGVSYDSLGEAGLQFLTKMAAGGGKARVLTTLNPAGMDIENWQELGINPDFADKQRRVIQAFTSMDVISTCTCTPYLAGNLPVFGQHIAWAESSAVCYANAVIGARTNREGGPSALAASLSGRTPLYGFHLDKKRVPTISIQVKASLEESLHFGALGKAIGEKLETSHRREVPFIQGVGDASLEDLKSLCASIATFGGVSLFHLEGITPEAHQYKPPRESIRIAQADLETAIRSLNDAQSGEVDFVSLGCPHLSIKEIARIARLLEGKKVTKEFWITTARPMKHIADRMGYTKTIEESGAKFAADTCCVVAPVKGRFKAMATDSAKACYYAYAKNNFKTVFLPFDEVILEALRE